MEHVHPERSEEEIINQQECWRFDKRVFFFRKIHRWISCIGLGKLMNWGWVGWLIDWLIDWRPFACLFIYLLVVCFLFMFHEHLNLCCFCVLFRMIWRIINESMWNEIPGTTSTCHLAGRPPQVLDKQEDKGMVEGRWCTVEAQCFFCISHGIRIVHETCAKMRLLQQDAWKLVNPNCKR